MGKIHNNFNISVFIILMFLLFCLNISATTRIAIVSEESNILSDLLTADLSDVKDVELLERSEIRKILKEHKISAASFNYKQPISLNKLLKTDIFVVIESEKEGSTPIGIIVFDAETGVRYQDCALPEGELDKVAKFAADAVRQALEKREKASEGKLNYISLAGVRNVDLGYGKIPFCDAVGVLFMRELGNSDNFAILERAHLEWLIKERHLPGIKQKNSLLTSTKVLEIEIRTQNEGKGITATLFSGSDKLLTCEFRDENPEQLASMLASQFAKKIDGTLLKPEPLNKKQEVKKLFYAYNVFHDPSKIMAMHALDPTYKRYAYFKAVQSYARSLSYHNRTVEKSLDLSEYLIDLSERWSEGKLYSHYSMYGDFFYKYMITITENREFPEKVRQRASELLMRYAEHIRKLITEKYGVELSSKIKDFDTYEKYTTAVYDFFQPSSITFKPFWEKYSYPIIKNWLQASGSYKLSGKQEKYILTEKGMLFIMYCFPMIYQDQGKFDETMLKQIRELLNIMLEHPVNALRIAGKVGLIKLDGYGKKYNAPYWQTGAVEIAAWTRVQLRELGNDKKYLKQKKFCYELASDSISFHSPDDSLPPSVAYELFDFMIERKELSSDLIRNLLEYYCSPFNKPELWKHEKIYNCITKILQLCDDPKTNVLYDQISKKSELDNIRRDVQRKLTIIYTYKPDLCKTQRRTTAWKKILEFSSSPLIYEHNIWILTGNKATIQLSKINLLKGKVENINGQEILQKSYDIDISSVIRRFASQGKFITLSTEGIMVFSMDNKFKPMVKKIKLASLYNIYGAAIGDKILITAGCSVFYTYLYDMKTSKLELISSSSEKEKRTPFSNIHKPIQVHGILSDPQKNRFLISLESDEKKIEGLWEFNLNEKEWKKLLSLPDSFNLSETNGKIIMSSSIFCYEFDLNTDKAKMIYFRPKYPYKQKNFYYPAMKQLKQELGLPYALTDTRLWSGGLGATYELSSVNLKTGKVTCGLKIINEKRNIRYLNVIGDNYLIVGYDTGTYYLMKRELETEKDKGSGNKRGVKSMKIIWHSKNMNSN